MLRFRLRPKSGNDVKSDNDAQSDQSFFCGSRTLKNAVACIAMLVAAIAVADQTAQQVAAQNSRSSLPRPAYFQTFPLYHSGDFARAGRQFQRGFNTGAHRVGEARYLDSICYLTMMGECNFHMGNYADALANYDQALKLYLSFNQVSWQRTVQVPTTLSVDVAAFQKSQVNWGTPTRNASIPNMPDSFTTLLGRVDAFRAFVEGGPVDTARLRPVNVTEVMRCTALALHRRRHLLGALNRLDPLTTKLLSGLRVAGAGDGSILGAYNGVLLGIAMASMERYGDAARMLTKSLQINGRYDHALTPVALVELTQISLTSGKSQAAATFALEASYSAGVFGQYDLVNEALSLGTANHLMALKTPYPPLARAIEWSNRERARLTQLSLIQRLAECHAESANTTAARTTIALSNSANRGRNTLSGSVANARLKYTTAVTSFTEGNFGDGLTQLADALSTYQNGSLWLYRLRLAVALVKSGSVSELEADRLLESLLHDPSEAEWKFDPIEPMSFLVTDHVTAMEAWFDILIRRRQYARALSVSELIRRHRFYSTLPLGGRLLGFRHGLNADEKTLDVATVAQRNSFLQRNAGYAKLKLQANAIEQELIKLPLQPDPTSEEANRHRQLLGQLSQVSATQEALMASYALSREPSTLAFPPQMPLESFQRQLPKGTLCMSALETASGYHLFFVSRQRVRYVKLGTTKALNRGVQKLLADLGAVGVSTDTKKLESDQWKATATKLKEAIFADIPDDSFLNVVELVVIPDGMLWYFPFEALPLTVDGEEKFLVDLCPVRYSPTMFLSVGSAAESSLDRTSVAIGKMHPRGETTATTEAFAELSANLPAAKSFEKQTTPSGLSAWLTDHLLVWSHSLLPANEYEMRPIPFDVSEQADVRAWMSLPWNSPDFVSLPGLQTFGKGRRANGSEMFLAATTLMASGPRTILLPRWQTGGATALGLTRIYTEHLAKKSSGTEAIQKAMTEARSLKFDIANEPQIKEEKDVGDISLSHPFFWAGFFVIDQPRIKEAPAAGLQQPANNNSAPPVTTPAPNPATSPADPMQKPDAQKANPPNLSSPEKPAAPAGTAGSGTKNAVEADKNIKGESDSGKDVKSPAKVPGRNSGGVF